MLHALPYQFWLLWVKPFGVLMDPKNLGDAGAPPPWDRSMTVPAETRAFTTCLHTKFRRSRSKLGVARPPTLGMRTWLTRRNMLLLTCVTVPNSVILGRNNGDCQKILTLPFKVTQGHWNRHGSIGYL